jgi:hypothetical protein
LKGTDRGLFEGTLSPHPGGEIDENHRKRPGIRSGDFLSVKEALPTPEQCLVTADKLECSLYKDMN